MTDLTGKVFGDLTVEWFGGNLPKSTRWVCRCSCDEVGIYSNRELESGKTTHCGCKGGKKHPLYPRFLQMIERCYNPLTVNYKNYGGKGVTVCARWLEPDECGFENFIFDMQGFEKGLTLDRIDPNGNYEPSNCRWVTQEVQHFNTKRFSTNKSGRTGVSIREDGKYFATIRINKLVKSLGVFDSLEEAIESRELAEIEQYGFVKEG